MSSQLADVFMQSASLFLAPPANTISGLSIMQSSTAPVSLSIEYFLTFPDSTQQLTAMQVASYLRDGKNGSFLTDLFRSNLMSLAQDQTTFALYQSVSVGFNASVTSVPALPTMMPSAGPPKKSTSTLDFSLHSKNALITYTVVPIVVGLCICAGAVYYFLYGRKKEGANEAEAVSMEEI